MIPCSKCEDFKTQVTDNEGNVIEFDIQKGMVNNESLRSQYKLVPRGTHESIGYIEAGPSTISYKDSFHIFLMFSEKKEHYRNVGHVFHELAFKESINLGKEGKVVLGAGYASILFHWRCGFRARNQGNNADAQALLIGYNQAEAYAQWASRQKTVTETSADQTVTEITTEIISQHLSNCTLNDVLAFYYKVDKASSSEEQKRLRNFIAETLMEVVVFLPSETIEQKKLEYGISASSPRANPYPLFSPMQQASCSTDTPAVETISAAP